MSHNSVHLDLTLWRDKELVIRQNKLKEAFWNIFSEKGNSELARKLCQLHPKSKGTKLTKGNDLLGFHYQVLDLIRDFNPDNGLNVRVLNWFGHGVYVFILFGKINALATLDYFISDTFKYSLSPTPWNYPELILGNHSTEKPNYKNYEKATYHQWFKEINFKDSNELSLKIDNELKKLIEFFDLKMG